MKGGTFWPMTIKEGKISIDENYAQTIDDCFGYIWHRAHERPDQTKTVTCYFPNADSIKDSLKMLRQAAEITLRFKRTAYRVPGCYLEVLGM